MLIQSFGSDTQNIDIFLCNQILKNIVSPNLLPRCYKLPFFDTLDLRLKYFSQPLIFWWEGETLQQFDLLDPSDKLAINKPIECLNISRILQNTIFIILNSFQFIFLCFITLSSNKCLTSLHLPITICIM